MSRILSHLATTVFALGCPPLLPPVEERLPAVCETGARVAFVRIGHSAREVLGGGTESGNPRYEQQLLTAAQDLGDEVQVLTTADTIVELAYHCGTNRIAALTLNPSRVLVLDGDGRQLLSIDTTGEGLALSPDGRFVSLQGTAWDITDSAVAHDIGATNDKYLWARDSTGVFIYSYDLDRLGYTLPQFVGVANGSTRATEFPSCVPESTSSTTGRRTHDEEILTGLSSCPGWSTSSSANDCAVGGCALPGPELPEFPCNARLRRTSSARGMTYDPISWTETPATSFKFCK